MRRLARWYARRIVNVNVNVVLAGAAALTITIAVMHPLELLGFPRWIEGQTGLEHKLVIGALTFIVDLVADIGVYYALHWLANHWPGRVKPKLLRPQHVHPTFIRDATMVQVERMVLGPVFYLIALGLQHALLRMDLPIASATAIAFITAMISTRVIHTIWMLRQQRRMQARMDQEELAAQMDSLSEEFDDAPSPNAAPQTPPVVTTRPKATTRVG